MAEAVEQAVPAEGRSLWGSIKPYLEKESLAAFFLGVSSGFPYAMIGATLTTRLAQDGIDKSTVTAFTLAFLVYNLKLLWAWIVDGVRIPGARPARPARVVDARRRRAGDRGGRQPRAGRSRRQHLSRPRSPPSWSASPARPSTS